MRSLRIPLIVGVSVVAALVLLGCSKSGPVGASATPGGPVVAVESFLADITRQVAGSRLEVRSLVPDGVDPTSTSPHHATRPPWPAPVSSWRTAAAWSRS